MNTYSIWIEVIFNVICAGLFAIWMRQEINPSKKKRRKERKTNRIVIALLGLLVTASLGFGVFHSYCAINPDIQSFVGRYEESRSSMVGGGFFDNDLYFETGAGTRSIQLSFFQEWAVLEEDLEKGETYRVWYDGLSGTPLKIEKVDLQ